MTSFLKDLLVLSSVFCWMSLWVEVKGQDDCPTLPNINPMILGLSYCKNTEFLVPLPLPHTNTTNTIGLMDKEKMYNYKVTDLRSKLEYFFDMIYFVQDYIGNHPVVLMRLVHQRITPKGNGETFTRQLVLVVNLVETSGKGNADHDAWKALIEAIAGKKNKATFNLSGLFPSFGKIYRYHGVDSADKCDDSYVYFEYLDPLKLDSKQFSVLKDYASPPWQNGTIGKRHTGRSYFSETDQTIWLDCQHEMNPNLSSGAAEVHCYGRFGCFQLILLAIFQIWIKSN